MASPASVLAHHARSEGDPSMRAMDYSHYSFRV